MTQKALYIDYEFCSGCHSCEVACRNEIECGIDDWGIKVLEDKPRQHADGTWHWDYIALPGELCDMCEKRTAAGKLPACVQSCQAKCLEIGTDRGMRRQARGQGQESRDPRPVRGSAGTACGNGMRARLEGGGRASLLTREVKAHGELWSVLLVLREVRQDCREIVLRPAADRRGAAGRLGPKRFDGFPAACDRRVRRRRRGLRQERAGQTE